MLIKARGGVAVDSHLRQLTERLAIVGKFARLHHVDLGREGFHDAA